MYWENVSILDTAHIELKLCYKELLHIFIRKPELNKQLNSQSKYEVKTLIIKANIEERLVRLLVRIALKTSLIIIYKNEFFKFNQLHDEYFKNLILN